MVTALVPSETACLASSPGRISRTAVCTSREEIVAHVLRAQGIKGPCRDYVLSTLDAMRRIGIQDHSLDWLSEALAAAAAASA